MKKLFVIIPVVIILAVIIIISVIANNNLKYEIEEVGQYNYFKLYKNQKYGVIDKYGNIIVDTQYNIVYIPNPSKGVFVCYYDYDEQINEYKTKVFDENKNEIFKEYDKVEAFVFKDTNANKIPFEKSVLKYKKDGKYGLIDYEGKKITENIYTSIESLEYKEGCFIVEQEGKFGVINLKGNTLVNIDYNKIESDGYYSKDGKSYDAGFIVAKKTEEGYKYGYINSSGNILLKNEYSQIDRVIDVEKEKDIYLIALKNGKAGLIKNNQDILNYDYEEIEYNKLNKLFAVKKGAKQGVVDINGKLILDTEYDSVLFSGNSINAVKNGEKLVFNIDGKRSEDKEYIATFLTQNENYIITVNKDSKYGVENKNGEILIENNYQYIEYAYDKYFIVTNNGKVGILNDKGEAQVDFEYDIIQRIEETNTMQAIKASENLIYIYDSNAKLSVSMEKGLIYIENNYIKILSDKDRIYIDNNGKEISNKEIYKDNNLFAVSKDGKWGFVDRESNQVVDYKYDMVTELNSYGYAGIKLNDLWGVIDKDANIIVEPSYKISQKEPDFINKYLRLNFGYGFEYYTDEVK